MKRIAPDVERLMWLIAEERDPRAVADFGERFPDLRHELSKRISMVSGLKDAGRKVPPHEIPRFVPKNGVSMPTPVNRSMYAAFAFVAAALAFGSYAARSVFTQTPPALPPVPAVNLTTPAHNEEPVYTKPSPGKAAVPSNESGPPMANGGNTVEEDNPLLHPVTFHNVHAPLESALAQVCKQAGLTYQMAPGMPQVEVELNYDGEAAGNVLADLGKRYNFTPYPQERGSLLFLPVRPDAEAGSNTPTSPPDSTGSEGDSGGHSKEGGVPIRKNPGIDGR